MIDKLPFELFLHLSRDLDMKEVCHLSMTCSLLSYYGESDLVWQPLMYKDLVTKHYSPHFKQFLSTFAKKCSWKVCYHAFYLSQNQIYPNFWDDADDLIDLDEEHDNLSMISLSATVKIIISQFLRDYQKDWSLGRRDLSTLAQIMAAEPKISSKDFIKTLLAAAENPRKTGNKKYYRVNSFVVSQFRRFKEETHENLTLLTTYREDIQKKFTITLNPTGYISQAKLFNASRKRIQTVVLRILETVLKHWEQDAFHKFIENTIKRSFKKYFWLKDTKPYRDYILYLLQSRDNPLRPSFVIDYFDPDIPPWKVAMQMTVRQHVRLVNHKLSNFVTDILPKRIRNNYSFLFDGDKEATKRCARKIQRLQEDLPTYLVAQLTVLGEKRKKIEAVERLIAIAKHLLELNNFYSLKETLGAVRGILQHASKSGLKWSNMDYSYLKKFLELESVLGHGNNYRDYLGVIEATKTHAIPVLSIHLTDIDEKLEESSNRRDVYQSRNGTAASFVYFNMEINRTAAREIGILYNYFTRR